MPLLHFASAPLLQCLIVRKENQAKKKKKQNLVQDSRVQSLQFHLINFMPRLGFWFPLLIVLFSGKDGPSCSQKWKRTFPKLIMLFGVLERQLHVRNPGRHRGCKEKEKAVATGREKTRSPRPGDI